MTTKQQIEDARKLWLRNIEDDKPVPLVIVPKETQPCSNAEYYKGTNFRQPWDVQRAILERVDREDVTFQTHV